MYSRLLRRLAASSLVLVSIFAQASGRVLYVTHEPGRWHDYSAQLADFREVAESADWELTIATGDKVQLLEFLRSDHYAAGQDAVVYNFCLADSRDMTAMQNLIAQTVEGGIPAVLVHCAMHSWWDSFKEGEPIPGNEPGLARAHKKLQKHWLKQNPGTPLPAWGDFTGVASTRHGPREPIELTRAEGAPLSLDIPDGHRTAKTELYNNHYLTPGVIPLLWGVQGNDKAITMWLVPRGHGQVIGLTLGHDEQEWQDPVFRNLIRDAVNYLIDKE